MKRRFAAPISILVLATSLLALPRLALAQLHPNPVMNQVLRSQLGWPSMAELLTDAARQAGALRERVANLGQRLDSARTRYWAAYPNGTDFKAAKQQLEDLLRSKDFYHLQGALTGTGAMMGMISGQLDNGIPDAARAAFDAWVEQARKNLEATGSGWSDVAKAREAIIAADPQYLVYVSRRNLEEFRRAGKQPAGANPETWRIGVLGAQFKISNVADAYGTAEQVVQAGRSFSQQCPTQASAWLQVTVSPTACKCMHEQFKRNLEPWDLWLLETELSRNQFLQSAVAKSGLPTEVSACLAK